MEKELLKLIDDTSNKHSLNREYSIEMLIKELNKLYTEELTIQKGFNNPGSFRRFEINQIANLDF